MEGVKGSGGDWRVNESGGERSEGEGCEQKWSRCEGCEQRRVEVRVVSGGEWRRGV